MTLTAPKPITPKPPEPSAAAEPAPSAFAAPPPAVPAGTRFTLSGILMGPGGTAAIINDHSVRAGETIDGARVLRIDRFSVVLDVAGRQLTLRM